MFAAYHRRLARTVEHLVNTSPDIVDDACNFAWSEFIRCQPDRDRSWRSWLITTAQREAWRLHAKEAAHTGLELPGTNDLIGEPVDPRDALGAAVGAAGGAQPAGCGPGASARGEGVARDRLHL